MGGMAAGLRGKCRDRVGGRGGRRRRTEGGGRGAEGAGPRGCDTGRGGAAGLPRRDFDLLGWAKPSAVGAQDHVWFCGFFFLPEG